MLITWEHSRGDKKIMDNNLIVEEIKIEDLQHYNELMKTFKICLRAEAGSLIKESRDYILSMREDIKDLQAENKKIKADCISMAKILNEKFKEL